MRISRLLVRQPLEPQSRLTLEGEASHYLRQVLRLRKGMALVVFDGLGMEAPALIEGFGRDETHLRLGAPVARSLESPLKIHLALGLSRAERMDLSLQKAVELGVQEMTPLITEFGVVRLDEDKRKTRAQHWARILQSACEQSGRNHLPTLYPPEDLLDWLRQERRGEAALLLDPRGTERLKAQPAPKGGLTLLIGPEGGFSEAERTAAIDRGFTPIRFGPRTLRTETAVIAAISAAQTLWGDLGDQQGQGA